MDKNEDYGNGSRQRKSTSVAARSLGQTRHAARTLVPIGTGHHMGMRSKTRAEVKEVRRAREWARFCRRKSYLSLDDLPKEERPRTARKGTVTPFSLQLIKVTC